MKGTMLNENLLDTFRRGVLRSKSWSEYVKGKTHGKKCPEHAQFAPLSFSHRRLWRWATRSRLLKGPALLVAHNRIENLSTIVYWYRTRWGGFV